MPTYRCFCQTIDRRIITGARLEATDLDAVLADARLRWQDLPDFACVEVWLRNARLWPADAPAIVDLPIPTRSAQEWMAEPSPAMTD